MEVINLIKAGAEAIKFYNRIVHFLWN